MGAPGGNSLKNNPFADKGYFEKDGVLVKADAPGIAAAFICDPYFRVTQSTDEQRLNKTESAYLAVLRCQHSEVGIQNITLKLGDDCRYTPDFNVLDENGRFAFHEVKGGFFRDDAKVKLQVAARQFRMFHFVLVRKNGTGWDLTDIKP